MEQYVGAYKPNKGDILQLPFIAFADKGKVGDIIYVMLGSAKFCFKYGDEVFGKVNGIPKFIERLRNAWAERNWLLYLCSAERLDGAGIEYEKKSDIKYSFIDYLKAVVQIIQVTFRRIYVVEIISE